MLPAVTKRIVTDFSFRRRVQSERVSYENRKVVGLCDLQGLSLFRLDMMLHKTPNAGHCACTWEIQGLERATILLNHSI